MTSLVIGEIYREHGIAGQAKVYIYSGEADNFRAGMSVLLKSTSGQEKKVKLMEVKPFKKWFLTRFDAFKCPEDIQAWRKALISVDEKDLAKLEEDEFYISDLIGFQVFNKQGQLLGVFKGLEGSDASLLYVIEGEKEILVPANGDFIGKIDQEARAMTMDLPEGLGE